MRNIRTIATAIFFPFLLVLVGVFGAFAQEDTMKKIGSTVADKAGDVAGKSVSVSKKTYRVGTVVGNRVWTGSKWVARKSWKGGTWVAVKTRNGTKWVYRKATGSRPRRP